MGQEQDLEKAVFSLPKETLDAVQGHPLKVIELLEKFTPKAIYLGREKANFIVEDIKTRKKLSAKLKSGAPLIFAELGCYMGYSAILLSHLLLSDSPNAKYYSFEISAEFAAIAQKFINLAGLENKIEIIVGPASKTLQDFGDKVSSRKHGDYTPINFVLIDHKKDLYVPDLRILESLNFIAPGTILVGDNILYPGAPEYHSYVNASPEEKREHNYNTPNVAGSQYPGRWNIVYETKSIESPAYSGTMKDRIDISECVDYLNG